MLREMSDIYFFHHRLALCMAVGLDFCGNVIVFPHFNHIIFLFSNKMKRAVKKYSIRQLIFIQRFTRRSIKCHFFMNADVRSIVDSE